MEHKRAHRIVFVGPAPLALMAAICFKSLARPSRATAVLATRGAPPRASAAVEALLREMGGVDWRSMTRKLDVNLIEGADLVVTLGRAGTGRPHAARLPAPARWHEHWALPPAGHRTSALARARQIRDNLRARVAMLIFMEGWGQLEMSREAERRTRPAAPERDHPFIPMRSFEVTPSAFHPS